MERFEKKAAALVYHDDQVLCGGSEGFQGLRFIRGTLVVEGGPCDVKRAGPVDGARTGDVVGVVLGLQGRQRHRKRRKVVRNTDRKSPGQTAQGRKQRQ